MSKAALRRSGTVIAAVLLVATAAAQTPQPASQASPPPQTAPAPSGSEPPSESAPQEQPTFRTGIDFVRVDVIVTDRQGNPVTDLREEDFEIVEDGKPQTIETFRLVKIDTDTPVPTTGRSIITRADEESAAADENSRIFVFFLDDYHVRLGSGMAARRHLVEFAQNQLRPTDLVAVMYPLAPLDAVTLTRNHASVIRALEAFEGRKYNYQPRNAIEERYALYPTEVVERIRRQVSLSALEGLSVKLGSLREGRKAILLISEGYTGLLPPQMRDEVAAMPGLGNPARNNPFAGENNPNEDRARFSADLDVQRELQEVFDAANRNNTAIYSIDPRGLSTGEFDVADNISIKTSLEALGSTQDTLRVLAEETDGRAIVNRNDLAKGMQQIIRDSSYYYLVGYNSSQAPRDGKFHEIKVRVKRPGAQIRARKGYWALTPGETARASAAPAPGVAPEINRALASLAQPVRGRYVRTWIGTSPGADGKTKVTFVWEPMPIAPGTRRAEAHGVALLAASPGGELYFKGPAPASSVTFDVPPGPMQLRVGIEDDSRSTLDTDEREIIIPDLTRPELALSTPRLHLARNAREYQTLVQDPAPVPSPTREFRRTDRLMVRGEATGAGSASLTFTARLLNRQGQRISDVPVAPEAGAQVAYRLDLPLASFAPGDYLLEIAASSEGQTPATELVAFRVGS